MTVKRFADQPPDNSLLRQWRGPLTERLVREPGLFGLGQIPVRNTPDALTHAVCGFCSTGCSLTVHLREGEAISLSANPDYPVNLGMACPKGWEALSPLRGSNRATTPLARAGDGVLKPVEWDSALRSFVEQFQRIQSNYGPDALAWLGTGQIPTEELAFLGTLAKFGMGIRHGDGNTRQCMATAVTAYKQSFGFDAPPYTYADLEESDIIVLVGSNLCIAHPILWQRVLRNRRNPEIIVIDPRRTETAMAATEHFAIYPKSDLSFFYGVAHELIRSGAVDRAFIDQATNGFDQFEPFLADFTPARAARESGIAEERICSLAERIGSGKRVSLWWTMGVNQSHEGTRVAQALINLALMTGNIGKPGAGANSITGQCNAMGSRLFSNTTSLFGGRDFANSEHRREVADILQIPVTSIPDTNSLAYDEIIERVEDGRIRGLWIIATNTAHSWIENERFKRAFQNLECLVVQDMYWDTATARMAHIVFPAAGWGEKDGTFINSERRIGRVRKVRRAPGVALADFHIFQLIAEYWGCARFFARWERPETVFQILKTLSAGRPCDFSGIRGYAHIDEANGIQWPYPSTETSQPPQAERRLFEDRLFYHPDGRARFLFEQPRAMPEPPCERFPVILLTGRGTSAQWHTGTRTENSSVLRKLHPSSIYIEINPEDAEAIGIRAHATVRVASRRGELIATVHITHAIPRGQAFIPMHYPEVNRLTLTVVDPYSRQPAFKACAVNIRLHQFEHVH